MELKGKHVIVVGLGKTGFSTAKFLSQRGALVTLTDLATPSRFSDLIPVLRDLGVHLELGHHSQKTFENAQMIVVSPGVPHTISPIREARAKGVEVLGEIELASRFIKQPIAAVTGTNGKTTTTELLTAMLNHSGLKVFTGGNIGTPLIDYVEHSEPADILVVEISSFQLDTIAHFKPKIALLLNITEDHLDRYENFEAYVQSKGRIFENQNSDDFAILNYQDQNVRRFGNQLRSQAIFFNAPEETERGAVITPDAITFSIDPENWFSIESASIGLTGNHNLENVAAAGLAALVAGGHIEGIVTALSQYKIPHHRLEYVATKNSVLFYDDSKATNVDAVKRALETFPGSILLIMGGRDKGGDYGVLKDLITTRVKMLVLLGESQSRIRNALGHLAHTLEVDTMEDAVEQAYQHAVPGDIILLSPACASFDMFDSYVQRGTIFQSAVKRIAN